MKRIILSTLAASFLAASSLSGVAAPLPAPNTPHAGPVKVDWHKPGRHVTKKVIIKKKVVRGHHWRNGERYGNWRGRAAVDWRRHHLHQPRAGQRWIRVDNDYLLVSIASGVIAGVIVAR